MFFFLVTRGDTHVAKMKAKMNAVWAVFKEICRPGSKEQHDVACCSSEMLGNVNPKPNYRKNVQSEHFRLKSLC